MLVAILVTGTRGAVVLLAGFAGVAGATRKGRVALPRVPVVLFPILILAAAVTPIIVTYVSSDPTFFSTRLGSAVSFFQGANSDPSYVSRAFQYSQAAAVISAHPILGTGPGFLYPDIASSVPAHFTLDTPLVSVAKFGYVGSVIIIGYLALLIRAIGNARRITGFTMANTTARAFGFIFLADLPLGGYLEDKGLSIALMLVVGLLIAMARESIPDSADGPIVERHRSRVGAMPDRRRIAVGAVTS
jgi:O-antigen ligase